MASLEQIQLLIEELGPATEEVVEVQQSAETSWDIFIDETESIGIDIMEGQDKLMLSSELGRPPDELQAATWQWMLVYNFAWQNTGGIKLALEAAGGNVVMMFELNSATLDLPTLQSALINFAVKARLLRVAIVAGTVREEPAAFDKEDFSSAIRV